MEIEGASQQERKEYARKVYEDAKGTLVWSDIERSLRGNVSGQIIRKTGKYKVKYDRWGRIAYDEWTDIKGNKYYVRRPLTQFERFRRMLKKFASI